MNIGRAIGYWSIAYIFEMVITLFGVNPNTSDIQQYLFHMFASILSLALFSFFSYYWAKLAFDKLYYGVKEAAWLVGILWVVLTIVSDLFFWHILNLYEVPLKTLLNLYCVWKGNFKLIVLLSQLFTPRLWAGVKIRKFRHGKV